MSYNVWNVTFGHWVYSEDCETRAQAEQRLREMLERFKRDGVVGMTYEVREKNDA